MGIDLLEWWQQHLVVGKEKFYGGRVKWYLKH